VPFETIEIDLIGIRDGKLIIVECKDTGRSLTEDEAKRLVDLSNFLKCSRLLFVTPTDFPQAKTLFPLIQERCTARLEWWESQDIFDQSDRERMGMGPDDNIGDSKSNRYLERLVSRIGE